MNTDYPILIFPNYKEVARATLPAGFGKLRLPSVGYNWRKLGPKFTDLQKTLDNRRMQIQQGAEVANPEDVLVLETAGRVDDFYKAVKNVDGLEWLLEEDIDGKPDEEFYNPDNKEKDLGSRLYLVSTNSKALKELQSLFERHAKNPQERLPQGYGKFKEVFAQLRTVRFWDYTDRLDGSNFLEEWLQNNEAFPDKTIKFQVELWYRGSQIKRDEAQRKVTELVDAGNGKVLSWSVIKEIRYHAMLVELPTTSLRQMIDDMEEGSLIKSRDIMYFKPMPQLDSSIDTETEPFQMAEWEMAPLPSKAPVVALLDGYPLQHHSALDGRLSIDDPDGYEERYKKATQREHGTEMASLIIHGDLSAPGEALDSFLYVRPIMYPEDANSKEGLPEDRLVVDLVHRAVKRLFEGENRGPAAAPGVRIINFSIGDPARVFHGVMSPMARLLDWLSYKYNVLFIISAGNIQGQAFPIECRMADFRAKPQEEISKIISKALTDKCIEHRIFSPAESINNLTIGAVHADASSIPEYPARVNPFDCLHPAIYSAFGGGHRNSIKPDMVFDGGRQLLYDKNVSENVLYPAGYNRNPGLQVACPGKSIDNTIFVRGTSGAAALVSRNAYFCYKELKEILDVYGKPDTHMHLLIKALAAHGCSWEKIGGNIEQFLREGVDKKDMKRLWMGYGYPDFQKSLLCSPQRVTVLGFSELKNEEAHSYSLPLPPSLSNNRLKRRLTITLAWMSPVASENQKYRKAKLWVDLKGDSDFIKRIGGKVDIADGRAAQRGTLQHEVYEGESRFVFEDGDTLNLKVSCIDDAGKITEPIKYALAVSLDVAEPVAVDLFPETIDIYNEVKERLRVPVLVSNN